MDSANVSKRGLGSECIESTVPDAKRIKTNICLLQCSDDDKQKRSKIINDLNLPDNSVADTLEQLRRGVRAILTPKPIVDSLQSMYQSVDNLCAGNYAEMLYQILSELIESHVKRIVKTRIVAAMNSKLFLVNVMVTWNLYCRRMKTVRAVFLCLDRKYVVLHNDPVLLVWDLGLALFRRQLLLNPTAHSKIVTRVMEYIQKERLHDVVPRDEMVLLHVVNMFRDLNIYDDFFAMRLLDESKRFYSVESQNKIECLPISQYLRYVETRVAKEIDMARRYYREDTAERLTVILRQELITRQAEILTISVRQLLAADDFVSLKSMHAMFAFVPDGDATLKGQFRQYVDAVGREIVGCPEVDFDMVRRLLDLKARMDGIVRNGFQGDAGYAQIMKDGYKVFVNRRPEWPAILLAKYLDELLREGNKVLTSDEQDRLFDLALSLYRAVDSKDLFEAHYKKALARRLLHAPSASVDAEESVLAKLRRECGDLSTSDLATMFKDVELGHHLNAAYPGSVARRRLRRRRRRREPAAFDVAMSVNVLTSAAWPACDALKVALPANMVAQQQAFTRCYEERHSGRKLHWPNTLDRCVVTATYPLATNELVVGISMLLVLLQFNDKAIYTYGQLASATNIPRAELLRCLQSLACGKHRLLQMIRRGREVTTDDMFGVNWRFSPPCYRLVMLEVQRDRLEGKAVDEEVEAAHLHDTRMQCVDAALVRLMKTRGTMTHAQLVTETHACLGFPVKVSDMKLRIEIMIEKDYFVRGDGEVPEYKYVP